MSAAAARNRAARHGEYWQMLAAHTLTKPAKGELSRPVRVARDMIIYQEEDPILEEIDTAPEDSERRLVYADWLEERGDARCEFVRLEIEVEDSVAADDRATIAKLVARLRRAGAGLDVNWKRRLMRSRTTEILVALDSLSYSNSAR